MAANFLPYEVGEFYKELRVLAKENELKALSITCLIYCNKYPHYKKDVIGGIHGLLHSNYFSNIDGFDYEVFIDWCLKTSEWPKWVERIKNTVLNPSAFILVMDQIIESVNKYKSANG